MALGVFAFHARHIAKLTLNRNAATVRHRHHSLGTMDILCQRQAGGIHHDPDTTKIDGTHGRGQRLAMIQMNGDRHGSSLCCPLHGSHKQFEIEEVEMRFRQTDDNGCLFFFSSRNDTADKIQTYHIKGSHRIVMLIGVFQHVTHMNQWHSNLSYVLFEHL